MTFDTTSVKLTGTPGDAGWSQVYEFTPQKREKLEARGSLFAVVSTKKNQDGVDKIVAGREILARLHEEYFGKIKKSAFNGLKDAVEKVTSEFAASWGNVEIAAVARLGKVVYSAASGGAKVVIFRKGMLAEILESKQNGLSVGQPSTVSASGYPKEKDILILATSAFFKAIPTSSFKAALSGKDLGYSTELLAPIVHSANEQERLGAIFIKFEKKTGGILSRHTTREVFQKPPDVDRVTRPKRDFGKILSSLFKKLPEKKIYVRQASRNLEKVGQSKKTAVSIGGLLLLLLLVSIGFGIKQKTKEEARESYESTLLSAIHEYKEAVEIFSLNPTRARELFDQSKQKTNELMERGISDPELDDLVSELEKGEGEILGKYKADDQLFLDLSLLSDGFNGNNLALSEEILYVFDKEGSRVVSISIDTKRSEVVAGPSQLEKAKNIAAYSDRVFVLFDDGIYEVGDAKKKVIEKDWEGDVWIYSYAGNLYVLEKQVSGIWRFSAVESGFSSRQNWFAPGVESDLISIVSWTIDGSIWMLDDLGKVLKVSMGNPQAFSIKGLFPEMVNPTTIYTNEELQYLYILEPSKNRVVVMDKSGEYKAQYISDKLKEANDFGVSEKESKIIFLTGEKLYEIELRH